MMTQLTFKERIMDIYDVEFLLISGVEGRAIVTANSIKEAKEILQLGMLENGFQMDGADVFDVLELDLLKEDGPRATIIGVNNPEEVA